MKQRTNSFTIHSFHLNFPNFIPEIIHPLYISTSILSTFFPWNREYVKINSLLIPYFSEFSFFFLNSKTRKKKDKFQSPLLQIHQISFTTESSLFIPTILLASWDKEWPKSILFDLVSLCEFLLPTLISKIFNKHLHDETHRGGGRQSRFPSISCPNSPLLHCPPLPLSKTWKTGGIIIGNDPRRNADMLHLFEHRAAEFNLGL